MSELHVKAVFTGQPVSVCHDYGSESLVLSRAGVSLVMPGSVQRQVWLSQLGRTPLVSNESRGRAAAQHPAGHGIIPPWRVTQPKCLRRLAEQNLI